MSHPADVNSLTDDQVAPISKEFIFEGLQLPTDIFVRMTRDKYTLIGKKGELAKIQHLTNYNQPQFRLYVLRGDFSTFISYVSGLTQKVMSSEKIPAPAKATVVQGLVDVAFQEMEANGFADVESLKKASEFVSQLQTQMEGFAEVDAILASLPENESKYATLVCLVSLMILDEMGLYHKQSAEKLALGALLHDVGLKFIPKEVSSKEPHLRTPEEIELYQSHPIKGAESLRHVKNISQDVLLIVVEHHELANGTGYPKRIRDVKISPLARIVSLASVYVDLIYHPGGKTYSSLEAIDYIQAVLGAPFNRGCFGALKGLVHLGQMKEKVKKQAS